MTNSEKNKATLLKGNAAIAKGDHEGFLSLCTDDTVWVFVGDKTLTGKEEVRRWMKETYKEPPKVTVDQLLAGDDYLTAIGIVSVKDDNGQETHSDYCDVWRFQNGKLAQLKAFVIKIG